MPRKKILFYTQVYFLDNALEYVKMLSSNLYDTHVIINLSPNQLRANILNLEIDITEYEGLISFIDVCKSWQIEYLQSYFERCASVSFAIFPTKRLSSIIKVSRAIRAHIIEMDPDYIHFDEFSNRHLFLLPFALRKRKKVIFNVHDPKMHSGETDLSRIWSRKILFKYLHNFVVFSEHSKKLLKPQLSDKKHITIQKLFPYTVYRKFLLKPNTKADKKLITFIGRISPYKGVELFVEAIDIVLQEFPMQEFVIGGKAKANYQPKFLSMNKKHLEIRNRFLSNHEISELVHQSKLVICPYIDATQSGVIMTSYALRCPVLVTNTGGLAEYVDSEHTGIIVDSATSVSIAKGICDFLRDENYGLMQKYLATDKLEKDYQNENLKTIYDLYK